MSEKRESAHTASEVSERERTQAMKAWEAERQRELDKIKAEIFARRRAELRQNFATRMKELWPVWIGVLLGLLAPGIKFVVQSFGPWCMEMVYPYVVLAQRPEVQVGHITSLLPGILLYTQFPLEGLFAYYVLRHTVRPAGVILEVAFLHSLGLLELWMLTGTPFFLVRG